MLRISLQRFAQQDSAISTSLVSPDETDAPRHAWRDRRADAATSDPTSLLVSYRSANAMIDCGLDWLGKLTRVNPSAIVLTHAHPDHAWGLKQGAPCPVYAREKHGRN